MQSSHLKFDLLAQNQAQKEVTVNEALIRIDALLNSGALSMSLTTPRQDNTEGDVYIIADNPIGAWSNRAMQIAFYHSKQWHFIRPNNGSMFWIIDQQKLYIFNGTNWVALK